MTLPQLGARKLLPQRRAEIAVLAALAVAPAAQAAQIVVGGACDLNGAVLAANTDTAGFGCPAGAGADTIHLSDDVSAFLLPDVTSEVILKGHGHSLVGAVLNIGPAGRLTVRDLDARSVQIVNRGTTVLERCTLRQDSGVSNEGDMTIRASLVTGNSSPGGWPIRALSGSLSVIGSRVEGNTPDGAIRIDGGSTATIRDTTLAGNERLATNALGGAIVSYGALQVIRSTFEGNRAEGTSLAFGGAIDARGTLVVANSTFSDNEASAPMEAQGGAIYRFSSAAASVSNTTLSGNRVTGAPLTLGAAGIHSSVGAVALTLTNTIVTASTGDNCQGSFTDGGGNFGCLGNPEVTHFDPVLRGNGGPTRTHALLAGSNAVDAGGTTCGLLTTDQRMVKRNGDCDSGAFELGGCPDDRFELEAVGGDNICWGAPIRDSGTPQRHLLCDQDWISFQSRAGSQYLVETGRLTGGADTLVSAYLDCSVFLGSDDDGGVGAASRLTVTPGAGLAAVKIEDSGGGYGPGKGYDVTVTCVVNCPCAASDGMTFALSSAIVSGPEAYEVCDALSAGTACTVDAGGILILGAGRSVTLEDGFSVSPGGELVVEIDPSLWPLE